MSDADRMTLRYCEEGTGNFGITPNINIGGVTFSMASADNSINDSATGFINAGFKPLMKVAVAGFTDPANNLNFTIVSVAAGKMVLRDSAVVTEIAGDAVTLKAPVMDTLRYTGESLKQENDVAISNEIRADRQREDAIRTDERASGDIDFELSFQMYNLLMEAALQSAGWTTQVSVTGVVYSMASGDNSLNDSTNQFVVNGFVADQWIKVSGFTEANNNRYFKIVSVAVGKIILEGNTVTTEIAGDNVTIKRAAAIVNGTTQRSFTFEKEYTDLVTTFALLTGLTVSQFSLSVKAGSIITGAFSFMGKTEASAAATFARANVNPPTYQVVSAVDDVIDIFENLTTFDATELSFQIQNNIRARSEIGELGPASLGSGSIDITGTLTAYFETAAILDKFLNFTTSSLAIVVEDPSGYAYIFEFPEVQYTAGERVAGGLNTDILATLNFSAFRDSSENITMRVSKFS